LQLILFVNVTANNVDEFIIGDSSIKYLSLILVSFIPIIFAHKYIFKNKKNNIIVNSIILGIQYTLIFLLYVMLKNNNYWTFVKVTSWGGGPVQRIASLDIYFFYIVSIELLLLFIATIKDSLFKINYKNLLHLLVMMLPVAVSLCILGYLLLNRPIFEG
jgi:hypothetical protein